MAERWETLRDSAAGDASRLVRVGATLQGHVVPQRRTAASGSFVGSQKARGGNLQYDACPSVTTTAPLHTPRAAPSTTLMMRGTPRTRAEAGCGPLSVVVGADTPVAPWLVRGM
jgi:hypothetical protein